MTAPPPPLPARLMPPEAQAAGDIDARILLVEQRLIAREEALRRRLGSLGTQLQQRLQPRRLLWPAAGMAAVLLGLLAWRRRPAERVRPAVGSRRRARHGSHPRPWVQLLTLAWPLVPERWRARVSPAVATSFVALGLPLLEHVLSSSRQPAAPLAAQPGVDWMQLRGRWFVVGELPSAFEAPALQPPELGLLARDDGQLDLLQRRIDRSGTHGRQALVQPVPGTQGSRLKLSYWPAALQAWPWAWSEHAVLHVNEAYDEALIGSPSRQSLWLLSRGPQLGAERRQALVQIAHDRGFAVERLRFISQD
ncbi:hypothetical protein DBR42_13700 [Pelomonas sp. HMWF004]|nr:hypothetical protein DBR42_13700 [Pelomonas sp. HMWF004]